MAITLFIYRPGTAAPMHVTHTIQSLLAGWRLAVAACCTLQMGVGKLPVASQYNAGQKSNQSFNISTQELHQ